MRTNITKKLEDWLNEQGYKMVSVKKYAEIKQIKVDTVYKRLYSDKIEYIQVDGTKILLIKVK